MVSSIRHCLFLYLITFKLVLSVDAKLEFNLHYYQFWTLTASWSGTSRHSDYSMPYPLVDYSEYAVSIDEFVQKYPLVTIETIGQAYSPDTFGDQGTGHFGSVDFETMYFNNQKYYRKYFVFAHESAFWWNTGAEIGVGFKMEGTRLYLQCFINGWIYSGGAISRKLEFGLGVSKVTFHPNNNDENTIKAN